MGLAAAIVVDASIIRLLIVLATMNILGPAAWWYPAWLDRLLGRDGTPAADPTALRLRPVERACPDAAERLPQRAAPGD